MSKIISLKTENVKRISAVEIKPDGNMVVIGGANGQGKSSVLDSIAYALGGKDELPSIPLRKGERRGSVVVELDDIVVKRSFTESGGTTLTVENKDGAKYSSPQAILDKLTGKLTFDPLEFTRLESKKQSDALKKILGLDFQDLDENRKKAYDDRTFKNRQVASVNSTLDSLAPYQEAPEDEIVISEVLKELDAAEAHNEKLNELNFNLKNKIEEHEKLKAEILDLSSKFKEVNAEIFNIKNEVRTFKLADAAAIRERVLSAQEVNKKVQINKTHKKNLAQLRVLLDETDRLTKEILSIDKEKEDRLKSAKFPVSGMSFNEHGVTLNGIPFDQASSAEQLRASVAMAAAMNPKIRVMLVRDGSLLDDTSMQLLGSLADEHDLQVWVERVGIGEHVSVVINDGRIEESK